VDVALLDQQVRLFRHTRGDSRRAQKRTGREMGCAPRSRFDIATCDLLASRTRDSSRYDDRPDPRPIGPVYAPAGADAGMTDSTPHSIAPMIGSVVIAFTLVTLVAGYLLGADWTQAVLVGGFPSVVAAASA
jgi:hypothetical protein